MRHEVSDNTKQRLIDRRDIVTAINILRMRGYDNDQLLVEITNLFYVDLDTYNEILRAA